MRYLLLILLTTLAACSNGGGGTDSNNKKNSDYQPGLKPVNAVSEADLNHYLDSMENTEKLMPADDAIFSVVLSGGHAEPVEFNKRQEALAKLSPEGQYNLQAIREYCIVRDAQSHTTGSQELKVGATQSTSGVMEISTAPYCPTVMLQTGFSTSTIRSISPLGSDGARITMDTQGKDSRKQTIESSELQNILGGSQMTYEMVSSGTIEIIIQNGETHTNFDISGTGKLSIELLHGDYIRGPLSFSGTFDSMAMKSKFSALYDLKTSRGVIRVVLVGTESSEEIYVNGNKIDLKNRSKTKMAFKRLIKDSMKK